MTKEAKPNLYIMVRGGALKRWVYIIPWADLEQYPDIYPRLSSLIIKKEGQWWELDGIGYPVGYTRPNAELLPGEPIGVYNLADKDQVRKVVDVAINGGEKVRLINIVPAWRKFWKQLLFARLKF